MILKKWVRDPIILGNDPILKGHGDSRYRRVLSYVANVLQILLYLISIGQFFSFTGAA